MPRLRLPFSVQPLALEGASPRGSGAPGVQVESDLARRLACGVAREDFAHDRGFGGVDRPGAANRLTVSVVASHKIVAEGVPAAGLADFDATAKTTSGLVRQVLEVERIHRTLKPDVQNADLAFAKCNEADAGELQALEERRDILLVSGEAIERLGNHDVEGRLPSPFQHRLISRAKRRCAAHRRVPVDLDKRPAFARDLFFAETDLVVDRSRALLVGRVPGVDDGAHLNP